MRQPIASATAVKCWFAAAGEERVSLVSDSGHSSTTASPVTSSGGWAGTLFEAGLDIAALLFLPILSLSSHAVAPLVAFAGLMALGRAWPLDRAALRTIRIPALLCVALVVWGSISAAWAIDPSRSFLIAARLAGLFAAAAMLLAQQRLFLAMLAAVLAAAAVYHFVGSAAKIGFAVALLALVLFRLGGSNLARAAAVLSVLVVLAAPVTLPRLAQSPWVSQDAEQVKFSLWHRFQIWAFVGDRIAERPLLGWGLDSSRAIPGGRVEIRPGAQHLPLHPHDAALQIWLELGLPGALILAGVVAWLWLALARVAWPPLYTAAAAAALATALFAALGTYGIWQEWWIATLSLALFLVLVMARLGAAGAETTAVTPAPALRAARSRT